MFSFCNPLKPLKSKKLLTKSLRHFSCVPCMLCGIVAFSRLARRGECHGKNWALISAATNLNIQWVCHVVWKQITLNWGDRLHNSSLPNLRWNSYWIETASLRPQDFIDRLWPQGSMDCWLNSTNKVESKHTASTVTGLKAAPDHRNHPGAAHRHYPDQPPKNQIGPLSILKLQVRSLPTDRSRENFGLFLFIWDCLMRRK